MKIYKAPKCYKPVHGYLGTFALNEPCNYIEGKCRLSVKVGKKRKLVKGVVSVEEYDCPETGPQYVYTFKPSVNCTKVNTI